MCIDPLMYNCWKLLETATSHLKQRFHLSDLRQLKTEISNRQKSKVFSAKLLKPKSTHLASTGELGSNCIILALSKFCSKIIYMIKMLNALITLKLKTLAIIIHEPH